MQIIVSVFAKLETYERTEKDNDLHLKNYLQNQTQPILI